MSFFSKILRSGGIGNIELGRRTGYGRLDDEDYGPGVTVRTKQPSRSKRIALWSLLPVGLLLIVLYLRARKEMGHLGTAARCQMALADIKYTPVHGNSTSDVDDGDESNWARIMSPTELMTRLEGGNMHTRILHQSWKDQHLPERFQKWSKQWRKEHGTDWVYVLWTDADNLLLTERYYPEFLQAYKDLPKEIYRADMARNMYMHRFGGVYADLDLVPLSPVPSHLPVLSKATPPPIHVAYVGHMSQDDFAHSIPNAFMASTPAGHPFWIRPMEYIQLHMNSAAYNRQPEALTGPVALRACVKQWEKDRDDRHAQGIFDEVAVLENGKIYPFSWWDAPFTDQCVCRPQSEYFDPLRCNSLYPDAWTITYWTHSWGEFSW